MLQYTGQNNLKNKLLLIINITMKIMNLNNRTKLWKDIRKYIPECQDELNKIVKDYCENNIQEHQNENDWNTPQWDIYREFYKFIEGNTINSYSKKIFNKFPFNKNDWNDINSFKVSEGCHWSNKMIHILLEKHNPGKFTLITGENHTFIANVNNNTIIDILHKNQGRLTPESIVSVNGIHSCGNCNNFETDNQLYFEKHLSS